MRRKNSAHYRRLLKTSPLENDHGALTPKRTTIPRVELRISNNPTPETIVKQPDTDRLIDELKAMHKEHMEELQALKQAIEESGGSKVVLEKTQDIMDERRRQQGSSAAKTTVQIDESIYVTDVETKTIEKGYENIAEAQSEDDDTLESSVSRLRALKRGE